MSRADRTETHAPTPTRTSGTSRVPALAEMPGAASPASARGSSDRFAAERPSLPVAMAAGAVIGLALLGPSPALAGTTAAGEPVSASRAAVVGQEAGERDSTPQPIAEVVLDDTAGIIDPAQLERDLADIEFRGPVTVAVYTERGQSLHHLDDDRASQEFNGRVLEHARSERPDWLSDDGQKWADGLFVYALDPDNRIMGVYMGEDIALSLGQQEDVREAATDSAREAKWTDAAVDAVDRAAELIGRPWYQHPGLYVGAGAGVLGIGGTAAGVAAHRSSRRRQTRRDLEAARTHLTNVTMDMDATEVNASTVPTDNPHGAALMERFRGFKDRTLALTEELESLEAVDEKTHHRDEIVQRAAKLRKEGVTLDALDDTIGAANTFLNRHPGWEDAWDLQTTPLREDHDGADTLLEELDSSVRGTSAAQALGSAVTTQRERLTALGGELTEQRTSPADALDELHKMRRDLSEHLSDLAKEQIDAYAKTSKERVAMRRSMDEQRREYRGGRSGSILDTTMDAGFYWRVWAYNSGYNAGRSSVDSSRSSSSSSGTGYGGGGGSFSGSGSSGRF